MKQKLYSEHVYSVCNALFGVLAGVDGLDVADLIDPAKLVAPHKECVLHDLIAATVDFYAGEWFYDFPTEELEGYRSRILEAGLTLPAAAEARIKSGDYTFEDKGEVYKVLAEANRQIVIPSAFHVLFGDRNFLLSLNLKLRDLLKEKGKSLLPDTLDQNGKIRRAHIPVWVRKAIFFRDRGECQSCGKDISGLRTPFSNIHLDHIIPLADFGNNDPTNLQLACSECNQMKGMKINAERARYVPYW